MLKRYTTDHRVTHASGGPATLIEQLMFLRRSGRVQRYHCEDLLKPQDVAQHSYGVAWLCWQLYPDGTCPTRLVMWALAHDAAEHATGDIPAPTKRELGISATCEQLESDLLLHNGIDLQWIDTKEMRVLKVADALDGVLHVLREVELGNRTLTEVWVNYCRYVQDLVQGQEWVQGDDSVWDRANRILSYAMEQYENVKGE